jgi:hypothetical protein
MRQHGAGAPQRRWMRTYWNNSFQGVAPRIAKISVTAGLKWAPDIGPRMVMVTIGSRPLKWYCPEARLLDFRRPDARPHHGRNQDGGA